MCKSKSIFLFYIYSRCEAMHLSLTRVRTNAPTPCLPVPHNITWYPINISETAHAEHLMCMRLLNTLVPQSKGSLSEDLGTVLEAALLVLTAVDKVWVVEGQLNSAVDNVVDSLYTQHE